MSAGPYGPDDVLAPPGPAAVPPTVTALAELTADEIAALGGDGLPPELQGRFADVAVLRVGAEAVIYAARPRAGGPPVALRVYLGGVRPDEEAVDRLARVSHQHVLRVLDRRRDGAEPYFEVLELVGGGTLRDLLDAAPGRRLPPAAVVEVVRQVAAALRAVHGCGPAHGDVKPDNVLVRSAGPLDLVLADFGLATVRVDHARAPGVGTRPYLSPEGLAGSVGHAGDWWALGVVVLEALTGRVPWAGLPPDEMDQRIMHRNADLSGVEDPRLRLLLAGLLTRTSPRAERWGWSEVDAWLRGESPPLGADWAPPPAARPPAPFGFAGARYDGPAGLGAALLEQWDHGLQLVAGEHALSLLGHWLADRARGDGSTAAVLAVDRVADSELPDPVRLLVLAVGLDPALQGPGLRRLAALARTRPDQEGAALDRLADVLVDGPRALGPGAAAVGAAWKEACERWLALHGAHEEPGAAARRAARARLLQAVVDPGSQGPLALQAQEAATAAARSRPWYADMVAAAAAADDPGGALARITLAGLAEREAAAERAAREAAEARGREEREALARERAARARERWLVRQGRARRALGWMLLLVVPLALAGLVWTAATRATTAWPSLRATDLALQGWYWLEQVPAPLLGPLAAAVDPRVTGTLAVVGLVLWWRSRAGTERAAGVRLPAVARHPLEVAGSWAAVLLGAALVPPLLPPVLLGTTARRAGRGAPGAPVAEPAGERVLGVVATAFVGAVLCYPGAAFVAWWLGASPWDGGWHRDYVPHAVVALGCTAAVVAAVDVLWLGTYGWRTHAGSWAAVWVGGGVLLGLWAPPGQGWEDVRTAVAAGAAAGGAWLVLRRLALLAADRAAAADGDGDGEAQ